MGRASVLALGAGLGAAGLRACGAAIPDDPELCPDGSVGLPFSPGEVDEGLAERWEVRTIDPPNLEDILKRWQLRIDGLVRSPLALSFDDLMCLERQEQVTDLHCVAGWSTHDIPWVGVHFSRLLDLCQPTAGATHLTLYSFAGFKESIPLEVALEPKTMLSYGVDDTSLPLEHGFPARVVIPRLLGYKSAKHVERIELDDKPVYGVWELAGYPYEAEVPPERLREGRY